MMIVFYAQSKSCTEYSSFRRDTFQLKKRDCPDENFTNRPRLHLYVAWKQVGLVMFREWTWFLGKIPNGNYGSETSNTRVHTHGRAHTHTHTCHTLFSRDSSTAKVKACCVCLCTNKSKPPIVKRMGLHFSEPSKGSSRVMTSLSLRVPWQHGLPRVKYVQRSHWLSRITRALSLPFPLSLPLPLSLFLSPSLSPTHFA